MNTTADKSRWSKTRSGTTTTKEGDIPHLLVTIGGVMIAAPVIVEPHKHARGNLSPVRDYRGRLLYALPGGQITTDENHGK